MASAATHDLILIIQSKNLSGLGNATQLHTHKHLSNTIEISWSLEFAAHNFKYFTRSQIWEHHSGFGGVKHVIILEYTHLLFEPEEHQPSGTCNFSRIDTAQLVASATAALGSITLSTTTSFVS